MIQRESSVSEGFFSLEINDVNVKNLKQALFNTLEYN